VSAAISASLLLLRGYTRLYAENRGRRVLICVGE